MKKPDPWVVTVRGGCRPPGVSGVSGAPNSRKKRSTDEPLCSSKLSERFVCTPITAGFTASTTSAKLAGPGLPRLKSEADDRGQADRSEAGQSCGARRAAEAPAAAANAMIQTRTAARRERDFFAAVRLRSCMHPRCPKRPSHSMFPGDALRAPHRAISRSRQRGGIEPVPGHADPWYRCQPCGLSVHDRLNALGRLLGVEVAYRRRQRSIPEVDGRPPDDGSGPVNDETKTAALVEECQAMASRILIDAALAEAGDLSLPHHGLLRENDHVDHLRKCSTTTTCSNP